MQEEGERGMEEEEELEQNVHHLCPSSSPQHFKACDVIRGVRERREEITKEGKLIQMVVFYATNRNRLNGAEDRTATTWTDGRSRLMRALHPQFININKDRDTHTHIYTQPHA